MLICKASREVKNPGTIAPTKSIICLFSVVVDKNFDTQKNINNLAHFCVNLLTFFFSKKLNLTFFIVHDYERIRRSSVAVGNGASAKDTVRSDRRVNKRNTE